MAVRLAIIGCGRIAHKHIEAVAANRNLKVVGFCDVNLSSAEKIMEEHKALTNDYNKNENSDYEKTEFIVTRDYMELIANTIAEVDAVAIATESGNHAQIAIDCMKQGKHVLVEKPIALSTGDARKMIATARENNVKLAVCHQNRFNPPVQMLKKAIDDGRFGKIIAANARILWNRQEEYYKQAPWRGTYKSDGGCLMNQCIHNIDLLQWLMGGDIEWVHGDVGNYIHPYIEAEDYGSIQIKFRNGAIGNVEGTVCVYPHNYEETLTIIGEKGTVVLGGLAVNKIIKWDFEDGKDDVASAAEKCNQDIDSVYGKGHQPLYQDFAQSIMNDTKPYITGEEGEKAMSIVLAAYQSAKEGKRILFPVGDIKTLDFEKER